MQNTANTNAVVPAGFARHLLDRLTRTLRDPARRGARAATPTYSIHVPGFGLVGYYASLDAVLDALRYLPVRAYVCDADGNRLQR